MRLEQLYVIRLYDGILCLKYDITSRSILEMNSIYKCSLEIDREIKLKGVTLTGCIWIYYNLFVKIIRIQKRVSIRMYDIN